MRSRKAWVTLVLLIVAIAVVLMRFNLAALPGPGRLETRLANRGRHFLIGRASRQGIPPPPKDRKASAQR